MTSQEELRQLFFESAADLLQVLNDDALRLEANPLDMETVRAIRRTVHTIKGDSAVLGFSELSELAHELEDVLAPESAASHGATLAEVVLSAGDMFDAMLTAYRGGVRLPTGDPLRAMIWRIGQESKAQSTSVAMQPKFAWANTARLAAEEAASRRRNLFNIAIRWAPECPMRAAAVALLSKALQECGDVLACAPELQAWADADIIEIALSTASDEESVSAKLFIPGIVANLVVQPWTSHEIGVARPGEGTGRQPSVLNAAPGVSSENVLRVDAAKVDAVLNLIGELVIGRSMLEQATSEFARRHPKDSLRSQFGDALAFQSQALRALQRAAMAIRMVPADQLFRRFPRLVRDVARQCGKQVILETSGSETELDKALVDALAEPLGHIVRNAIDHGIESPAERVAAGKSETGTVRLHAFHHANQMVIEIHDDGRGLDRESIVRRALERGLLTSERAATLDCNEITDFIFEPGFSTASEVTPVSGRGVGMDVVQAALRKLKGTVAVESEPGKGTTIRLKMPLTLAILRSMLFRVSNNVYAVPLDSVVEIRRAHEQQFSRAGNREVLPFREELVTIVRLQRMQPNAGPGPDKTFVVVLTVGSRKFGFVVDALIGEQELVIKPVDEKTLASTLLSGASVLGDGTVALVLNVEDAVRRFATAVPLPVPEEGTWNASNSALGTQH